MSTSSRFGSGRFRSAVARRGVLVAAAAALLLAGCGRQQNPPSTPAAAAAKPAGTSTASAPSAPAASAAPAAAASTAAARAKLAGMGVSDLLNAARTAYAQHQLVAPAGDNAIEYYEAALAKDPDNPVARDALREIFPFGVPDVENAISKNDFAEAGREIDLLAKADPTNYTLTLLRAKLDAQQKLQARQLQQATQQKVQEATQLARAATQRAAAARAAAAKAAAAEAAAAEAAAARVAAEQHETEAHKAAAATAKRMAAAPPPKPAGVTRGAEPVQVAQASYPLDAARNQTSGYAVVRFTVSAGGSISNVHVVDSSPRHVFDRAAVQAVERSTFKPALRDGQPVAAVLQRRIDFRFNQ